MSQYSDESSGYPEQLIPTLAMTSDRRLRRLFALVGIALDERIRDPDLEDELNDVMLDIAPEFMPPDATDDVALYDEWAVFIQGIRQGAR